MLKKSINFLSKRKMGSKSGAIKVPIRMKNILPVTEYCQGAEPLYLATLEDGKKLLLLTHSLNPAKVTVNWLPVDLNNLELANLIGDGIERRDR